MFKKYSLLLLLLIFIGISAVYALYTVQTNKSIQRPMEIAVADSTLPSLHQFTVNALDGKPVALDQFKGKKVIILNVASECGYTPQYADWQKFYDANKESVVVLGFPCNDFGAQEPGSATEIGAFCQKNYGVTFPMFEKVAVKGAGQAPLYQWLTDPAKNGWNNQAPSWNFCKYVVDENGKLTHFFGSNVKPDNAQFLQSMGL
jgi:glutathione peroxidase